MYALAIVSARASIRLDARLLHDRAELPCVLLDASGQLRRARWDRVHAAGGEALLHVGHVEYLHYLAVELVDDRLRRALGREQRGPGGGADLRHPCLLQRRPVRPELRALGRRDAQNTHAAGLEMR